ncbi:MAG: AlpA family transcriptional regulator [Rickettsiales bacterium]|nr:AlpA family transcriptional regulator [Rickettsiales bacterium]
MEQFNFLRLRDVLKRTGLSRSSIYQLMKDGKFPKQKFLSKRCVVWVEDEVHDWMMEQLEKQHAN